MARDGSMGTKIRLISLSCSGHMNQALGLPSVPDQHLSIRDGLAFPALHSCNLRTIPDVARSILCPVAASPLSAIVAIVILPVTIC